MNRPTGVTVISILCFAFAALFVCIALLALLGGGMAGMFMSTRESGIPAGAIAAFGGLIAIVMLIWAAVNVVVGIGLWKLKEWARIVTIVFAAIGLLGGVLSLFRFNVFSLVRIAIAGWILWYLLQPEVRAAFAQPRPAVTL